MPQIHSTTHLGYGPVISPTLGWPVCAQQPHQDLPSSSRALLGATALKPVLVPGQSPRATPAHVTGAARPFQRCTKLEGDCSRSLSGQNLTRDELSDEA
jgi:hypothetical protein